MPGAADAYVTVNLSVHQLSDATLLDSIAQALADSGLPPEALVLEVTESLLMSETSETVDALNGIHDMGVGLAIDDFGTGESSLARLKRFPVKVLKIDKSFVDGLGILETDEAIVAAIVQLSKALGLVVLAEGVETPAQLARVAALGCDLYQGYLMSRPVDAESRRLPPLGRRGLGFGRLTPLSRLSGRASQHLASVSTSGGSTDGAGDGVRRSAAECGG